jgi:hypothetical protein
MPDKVSALGPAFVVFRSRGEAWNPSLPMREQAGWAEHARFMNDLAREGFVILGGPLGDGEQTLLILATSSENAVRARLAEDPWSSMRLLRIESVQPWNILLAHDNAAQRTGQPAFVANSSVGRSP